MSESRWFVEEAKLLERIVINPDIFGGKPIIRGRRLAVEHVRLVAHERVEPMFERSSKDW